MFASQINDAPAAITLLEVCERERSHLGTPQAAAQEHRQDGAVVQPAEGGISGALSRACACSSDSQLPTADALRLRALDTADTGSQLCRQ